MLEHALYSFIPYLSLHTSEVTAPLETQSLAEASLAHGSFFPWVLGGSGSVR